MDTAAREVTSAEAGEGGLLDLVVRALRHQRWMFVQAESGVMEMGTQATDSPITFDGWGCNRLE